MHLGMWKELRQLCSSSRNRKRHWMLSGCCWSESFINCWPSGFFTASQPSLGFTENRPKIRKYPGEWKMPSWCQELEVRLGRLVGDYRTAVGYSQDVNDSASERFNDASNLEPAWNIEIYLLTGYFNRYPTQAKCTWESGPRVRILHEVSQLNKKHEHNVHEY